jgi:four helix bundle protein
VGDYKKLAVWEKAHQLTLDIYRVTASFPNTEQYGLTGQIRRSCASIPANIAEGSGRGGDTELGRFLRIATGSASELEYHLLLAHDLGFIDESNYEKLNQQIAEILRMLKGLIQRLDSKNR